jgi:ribosomal protein S18 acetylase RimI-like enzyme
MELPFDRIADYVDLLSSADPRERPAANVGSIRGHVESGRRILARTRVLDEDGVLVASIRVEPIGAGLWVLTELKLRPGIAPAVQEKAAGLVGEALATIPTENPPENQSEIRSENERKVESRIPVKSAFPAYTAALLDAGFKRHGGRIEFESNVADLPDDNETPFDWRAATAETLSDAAAFLDRVSIGDPDHDPADTWGTLLPALLGDSYLRGAPECVHIGRIGGETAAGVVAQVAPTTGWSRITYMGLLPSRRGRGWGRWVHRHGFRMMREQGGTTYQGGCASNNTAMVALFREHGCRESVVYDVWKWRR